MTKPKLTNADFCRASKKIRCEVAQIKAVAEVESRGEGFYADGFPVILFERHKFRSFTNGRYNKTHPHLSGPPGNYGKAGQNQRNKFNEAFALNPHAAMKACSWGKFQIMGFNYEVCGFNTVGAFVDAMKESEGRHLDAFCEFVLGNGLADELRGGKWAAFARSYNGADYAINKYDKKMEAAYNKFAKENIDCSQVSTVHPATSTTNSHDVVDPADNTVKQKAQADELPIPQTQIAETIVNTGATSTAPVPDGNPVTVTVERVSIWAKIGAGFAGLTGLGINFATVIENKLNEINVVQLGYALGALGLIAVALYLYDRAAKRAHEKTLAKVETASDPAKNTVELREQTK